MAVEQADSPSTTQPGNSADGPREGALARRPRRWAELDSLDWRIAMGFFAAALLIRGVYLWQSAANPTFKAPVVDAMTYHFLAAKLAGPTHQMDTAYFWQPFFYPFLLGVVYYVTGTSIVAARIVGITIGSLTCAGTYLLGRKVFGRKPGILAGIMAALYGPLIFWEADLMGDWLAAFWAVVLLLLLLRAQDTGCAWTCVGVGLCGVLAILTRPTMLPFFAAACAYLIWSLYRSGDRWRSLLSAGRNVVGGFLILALPFVWLNHHVTGNVAFMPSSGGINLYIGNNPDMERTLTIRPGYEWEELCDLPMREEGVSEDSQAGRQGFYYKKVRQYVADQPLSFLAGLGGKTARFVSSRELPRNVDIYMFRQWSSLLSALVWKAGAFGFPFGLLLPLTVAGAVLLWRRIPAFVWLMLALWPAAVILVFVAGRYRLAVAPAMIVVAAGGVFAIIDAVRRLRLGKLAVVAACVAASVAAATVPGPFIEEKVDYPAELPYDLGAVYFEFGNSKSRNDPARAEYFELAAESFAEAARRKGDYADAYNNLGNCRAQQGRLDEALAHLNRAVELNPNLSQAMTNMGAIYRKRKQFDEAINVLRRALAVNDRKGLTHYHMALALIAAGRSDEAVAHLVKTYELDSNLAHRLWARMLQADILFGKGRGAEAAALYRDVLAEAGPAPPAIKARALKGVAWILATCMDAKVRDGAEAVRLAHLAAKVDKSGSTADILAAAYAEAGMMEQAIRAASAAVAAADSAGMTEKAMEIRARLRLYQAGQPCRSETAYELGLP